MVERIPLNDFEKDFSCLPALLNACWFALTFFFVAVLLFEVAITFEIK
jgi:hypothetical protein